MLCRDCFCRTAPCACRDCLYPLPSQILLLQMMPLQRLHLQGQPLKSLPVQSGVCRDFPYKDCFCTRLCVEQFLNRSTHICVERSQFERCLLAGQHTSVSNSFNLIVACTVGQHTSVSNDLSGACLLAAQDICAEQFQVERCVLAGQHTDIERSQFERYLLARLVAGQNTRYVASRAPPVS